MFTRLRHDPRTQAYYERRTQEGKTRREIIRCLKRYAAREIFNLVRTASTTPRYRGVSEVFDHGEVEFGGTLPHIHLLLRGQAQRLVRSDELESGGG